MKLLEEIEVKLINSIGINRYNHSIRVMETAIKLAKINEVNCEHAKIAGILHDCGKFQSISQQIEKSNEFNVVKDKYMNENLQLLHAPLSAVIAQNVYKVKDVDILNSIKYHTTGRVNMSKLEKIIYIADYIEPNRDFKGVEEIRLLAFKDLDKAMLKAFNNTIKYVIERNWIIHENTIFARNSLILNETMDKNI